MNATNHFSLLSLFSTGDLMILGISVILVILSIMSWSIIIGKMRLWGWEKKNPLRLEPGANLDLMVDRMVAPFDKNLWFLSMVSYVSPFIGLFGTVWGVMDSFAAIGVNQSVSIGVIAPGLAAALGTTAMGLIAAIPAAVAYQFFSKKADELYNRLDDAKREIQFRR